MEEGSLSWTRGQKPHAEPMGTMPPGRSCGFCRARLTILGLGLPKTQGEASFTHSTKGIPVPSN